MKKLFSFTEQFFWSMVWVFILIMAGYALLAILKSKGAGTPVATFADYVTSHTDSGS